MTEQDKIDFIVDFLEKSYCGARMVGEEEMMFRIERAIAVMKTPSSRKKAREDLGHD